MKQIFFTIILMMGVIFGLAFYISSQNEKDQAQEEIKSEIHYDYDVVIVGAGLSGLSSAYHLNDYNVLVLEKESQAGGRVLTKTQEGINYDMGAIFSYPDYVVPFEIKSSKLIKENGPLALYYDKNLYFCTSILNCLDQSKTIENKNYSLENILSVPESRNIINAFFQTVHPGEIEDYSIKRQEDALVKYENNYYQGGNRELVDAYLENINSQIEYNATVTSVEEIGGKVQITYIQNDIKKIISAKTAIVTTPAYIAKKIIKDIDQDSQDFLQKIKYGQMIVVAIGLENTNIENFSYLVSPNKNISAVVKNQNPDSKQMVLLSYIANKKSQELSDKGEDEIINIVIGELKEMLEISENNIIFSDIKSWPQTSPIISDDMLSDISPHYNQTSQKIFIAGDYTYIENSFPYGMSSAIMSGENISQKIIKEL